MDSSGELNVSLIIKSPCGRVHGHRVIITNDTIYASGHVYSISVQF